CSNNDVLHHMKRSFELSNILMKNLKKIKTLKILTDDDNQGVFTYKRICSGDVSDEPLPKTMVIFRFQTTDVPNLHICKSDRLLKLFLRIKLEKINIWYNIN
ncbi:unnamed protein product, partial [Rotaria socialis]